MTNRFELVNLARDVAISKSSPEVSNVGDGTEMDRKRNQRDDSRSRQRGRSKSKSRRTEESYESPSRPMGVQRAQYVNWEGTGRGRPIFPELEYDPTVSLSQQRWRPTETPSRPVTGLSVLTPTIQPTVAPSPSQSTENDAVRYLVAQAGYLINSAGVLVPPSSLNVSTVSTNSQPLLSQATCSAVAVPTPTTSSPAVVVAAPSTSSTAPTSQRMTETEFKRQRPYLSPAPVLPPRRFPASNPPTRTHRAMSPNKFAEPDPPPKALVFRRTKPMPTAKEAVAQKKYQERVKLNDEKRLSGKPQMNIYYDIRIFASCPLCVGLGWMTPPAGGAHSLICFNCNGQGHVRGSHVWKRYLGPFLSLGATESLNCRRWTLCSKCHFLTDNENEPRMSEPVPPFDYDPVREDQIKQIVAHTVDCLNDPKLEYQQWMPISTPVVKTPVLAPKLTPAPTAVSASTSSCTAPIPVVVLKAPQQLPVMSRGETVPKLELFQLKVPRAAPILEEQVDVLPMEVLPSGTGDDKPNTDVEAASDLNANPEEMEVAEVETAERSRPLDLSAETFMRIELMHESRDYFDNEEDLPPNVEDDEMGSYLQQDPEVIIPDRWE